MRAPTAIPRHWHVEAWEGKDQLAIALAKPHICDSTCQTSHLTCAHLPDHALAHRVHAFHARGLT
eukprot:3662041-Rhodomonas_salina.1